MAFAFWRATLAECQKASQTAIGGAILGIGEQAGAVAQIKPHPDHQPDAHFPSRPEGTHDAGKAVEIGDRPGASHHSSAMRSGPSARLTRYARRRQVKCRGGSSGVTQIAVIGSGGANRRTGRGGLRTREAEPSIASALPRWREREKID